MDCPSKIDQCKAEIAKTRQFREEIPDVVNQLILTCGRDDCFDHVSPEPIPSKDAIIELIERARRMKNISGFPISIISLLYFS